MPKVPICEHYRGVGIHAEQPRRRIERIVKPELDYVLDHVDEVDGLLAWVRDASKSPESRLLACAKIQAHWSIATEQRRVRPDSDAREVALAITGALDSTVWRSPTHHCGLAEPYDGAVPREKPLADG